MKIASIPEFPNYIVQNDGIVKHISGRIMTSRVKDNGYYEVALSHKMKRKFFLVHRLVALSFIPPSPGRNEVNHKNGIKSDNRAENLEWCNSKENHAHAIANGLGHYRDGRNGFSKSVRNKLTGEIFETARMAYNRYAPGYGYVYFTRKLSGANPNDTPFEYSGRLSDFQSDRRI